MVGKDFATFETKRISNLNMIFSSSSFVICLAWAMSGTEVIYSFKFPCKSGYQKSWKIEENDIDKIASGDWDFL